MRSPVFSPAASAAALLCGCLCPLLLLPAPPARADEGMWPFNAPPRARLEQRYGFRADEAWYGHLQRSSVRFNSGGSGSFVSADGLVITNHHVGADALEKLSDERHNYLRDGFAAATRTEEKRCLDLELNVLEEIEDVTAQVNAAVRPNAAPAQALEARRAVIAQLELASKQRTGLRSDVVTLYQGGQYQLYRYRRYDDVRLVFAPEQQAAFYGGDPDNFEYPRFDLDICLFRIYENGRPLRPAEFLKFNPDGPAEHELVFVSGHPGSTNRELTTDDLAAVRDRVLPAALAGLYEKEVLLTAYGQRSFENARRARDYLFGVQNSRKALEGRLAGLLDPAEFNQVVDQEKRFRAALENDPRFHSVLAAYDQIQRAQAILDRNQRLYNLFEGRSFQSAFDSALFRLARTLVRAADEKPKPDGQRLPEFQEAGRPSLELRLFSEAPIYDDLEELTLTGSLTMLAGRLGADDPLTQQILDGKSPRERAVELVRGCRLRDVAGRRRLYEGGAAARTEGSDPMIDLARLVDETARAARKIQDEQTEVKRQAYGQIARARFALEGTNQYPDATFTLRLSYGTVEGYEEEGRRVPAFTHFAGLYERSAQHDNQPPFELPRRWQERRDQLDPQTPFDFVSTADIIGGNSGSPVVNRAGEFVGIIFDGNLQSLPWDEIYSDAQGRAVAVDSRAVLEALEKVYQATPLAAELRTGQLAAPGAAGAPGAAHGQP